jgi:peptidoglycan/xylan/chitin deacetylase (PgdA/CDA1 family)
MRFAPELLAFLVIAGSGPALAAPVADAADYDALNATLVERGLEARDWDGVYTSCKNSGQFALTFDDGPVGYGAEIASYLESKGARGTFFVNGYNYGCIYDRADDILKRYKAGHQIASHTWSHPSIDKCKQWSVTPVGFRAQRDRAPARTLSSPAHPLPVPCLNLHELCCYTVSDSALQQQIALVEEAIIKITGAKPAFFRPPYGAYNARQIPLIKARGYTVVTWDHDSQDALGKSPTDQIQAYRQLESSFPQAHLSLEHETVQSTARQVVPAIVPRLLAKGYKLTTVADCFGRKPYSYVGTPGKRDSSWTCSGKPVPGKN